MKRGPDPVVTERDVRARICRLCIRLACDLAFSAGWKHSELRRFHPCTVDRVGGAISTVRWCVELRWRSVAACQPAYAHLRDFRQGNQSFPTRFGFSLQPFAECRRRDAHCARQTVGTGPMTQDQLESGNKGGSICTRDVCTGRAFFHHQTRSQTLLGIQSNVTTLFGWIGCRNVGMDHTMLTIMNLLYGECVETENRTRGEEQGDWHPADVVAALKKRGKSLAGLSTAHGYHPTAAGKALKRPWPAIEAIISEALGVSAQQLWPSRYDVEGRPRTRLREPRIVNRERDQSSP